MSKVKEFTKNSPLCLKCGHKTKRIYKNHYEFGDGGSVVGWLKPGEYFIVTCQDCHYQFAQNVKKEFEDVGK